MHDDRTTAAQCEVPRAGGASTAQWNALFWIAAAVPAAVLIATAALNRFRPDQYIYLARSFTRGSLAVDDMPLVYPDYVIFGGHTYLAPGPLPALVLVPFLPLLDAGLPPAWLSLLFTALNVVLAYHVCARAGVDGEARRWTLLLLFGGTVYFAVAATMISWYFAHIVATTCVLLAVLEALTRRRHFLIGLLIGLAAAARASLVFALPFFLWLAWAERSARAGGSRKQALAQTLRDAARMGAGLLIPVAALLAYNYARFGDALETGYAIDVLGSAALAEARSHGLFSLAHVPRNLFLLLFQGPLPYPSLDSPVFTFPYLQPSPLGMGILFTSPALVLAARAKLRDPLTQAAILGVASLLIPLLTYYGTGWIQFGLRYTLDFMVFPVLVVARALPRPLGTISRALILLSVIVNLWGTAWLHLWV